MSANGPLEYRDASQAVRDVFDDIKRTLANVDRRTRARGADRIVKIVTRFLDDVISNQGMRRWLAEESELAMRLMGKPSDWVRFHAANVAQVLKGDFLLFELKPNLRRTLFGQPFTTNRHGLRDREYTVAKPPGVFRIVVLGSSIDMGWGVGTEAIYVNLLEDWLNAHAARRRLGRRFEVINFAVAAYSPPQRLEAFRRNGRGFWSLWIFLAIFFVTLFAEFIANDRPILVSYKGEWLYPVFVEYPEEKFGGFLARTARGDIHAQRVVNCAGADAARVAAMVGLAIALEGAPIQVSVSAPVQALTPHLVYAAGMRLTLKQASNGTILIGGGWPAQLDARGRPVVDLNSLRGNLRVAQIAIPQVGSAHLVRSWAGIVNGTADWRGSPPPTSAPWRPISGRPCSAAAIG